MIVAALLATGLAAQTARAIAIAPRERPAWVLLQLAQQIDPGADGGYDGLRIYDDRNRETPYVLDPAFAETPARQAQLSDVGFVRGRYTQALLDAGTGGGLYCSLSIQTPRDTFFDRVDVAISDDRATWRDVRDDALIYRVAGSGDPGSQSISFTPARARWIRVRVLDKNAPFPIDAASLDEAQAVRPAPRRLAAQTSVSSEESARSTRITFDLGTPHTHTSSVRIDAAQQEFARSVTLWVSDDAEHWAFASDGRVRRFAHGEPVLEVPTQDAWGRYVRADIFNGNDAPLVGLGASIYGPQRRLVFIAQPNRSYVLAKVASGSPPTYDLSERLAHDDPRVFMSASLGPAEPRRPAREFASQPLILTLAFAIAIAALGAVTIRTLRSGETAKE